MKISLEQAREKHPVPSTTIWEYDLPSEVLSFAKAHINGRYPESGRVMNSGCEEIYYVNHGSGIVHSEFGDYEIKEGDLYHFKKGEKYWTEGHNLELILANSPKWTPEQAKSVE